jgi:isopentenyl phosphate kinase
MVTLVKIGGSVITNKSQDFSPKYEAIERIGNELSEANLKNVIIGNGGGSYGHYAAKKYELVKGIIRDDQRFGFALTQDAVARLNRLLVSAILNHGTPAIGLQPSAFMSMRDGVVTEFHITPLNVLLDKEILPVVYGDTICDVTRGTTIASTETVMNEISKRFPIERIVIGTVVEGVLTDVNGGKLVPEINPDNLEKVMGYFGETEGHDVTGGMMHKVLEAVELAKKGVIVDIVNIAEPGVLSKALNGGKPPGTRVVWNK